MKTSTPEQSRPEKIPDWVMVPPRRVLASPSASSKYGAAMVAALHCGLNLDHFPVEDFVWKHGWRPDYVATVDPIYTAQKSLSDAASRIFVARSIEASFLQDSGFPHAQAIGMPISYAPTPVVTRRPNSLLVMPVHSLATTQHVWPFMEYATQIAELRTDFEEIVICVHPSCIENGYWINEFESLGFTWISGADVADANSLSRIRHLSQQFEYVTSNGLTSAVAYAAADGAKVSIYGSFCNVEIKDVERVPFYIQNPGMAEKILPLLREDAVQEHLGEFFCHPREAVQKRQWGRQQLGFDCQATPDALKDLLFREPENQQDRHQAQKTSQIPSNEHRERPDRKAGSEELKSLAAFADDESGSISIDGELYYFLRADQFENEYEWVINRKRFEFPCIYRQPLLIDACAGSGLVIRYWLSRLPEAQVIACENDPESFKTLLKNTAQIDQHQLTTYNTSALAHLSNHWKDQWKDHDDPNRDHPIEFLRLAISNEDIDDLIASVDLLLSARQLCLHFLSSTDHQQRLSEILQILENNGYRYHLHFDRSHISNRPLVRLISVNGSDQSLTIWACRGDQFPRITERQAV